MFPNLTCECSTFFIVYDLIVIPYMFISTIQHAFQIYTT